MKYTKHTFLFFTFYAVLFFQKGQSQFHIQSDAIVAATGTAQITLIETDFTNHGTFVPGMSTVTIKEIDGAVAQFIGGNSNTTFHHLTVELQTQNLELHNNININGDVTFNNGEFDLNGNDVDLGTTGTIIGESIGNSFIGPNGGSVKKIANLNFPNNENPGNIGASISATTNLGTTNIYRSHQAAVTNAGFGVERLFEINPTNNSNLNATLRFYYFDTELNSITENELELWRDEGKGWQLLGFDQRDPNANYVEIGNIDAFSSWTLGSATNSPLNPPPQPVCFNPTLFLDATGIANILESDVLDLANSSDNDNSIFFVGTSVTTVDCSQLNNPQTVIVTVEDAAGNQNTCAATVSAADISKPFFVGSCPSYPAPFSTDVQQCLSTINFTVPNASDNCGVTELNAKIWDSNDNVVQNWTTNPDGQYAPGTYKIKWRVKDASGNKRVCATNFTVKDVQNPDAQCVASLIVQLSGGLGSIATADIDAGSSDNCSFSLSLSKTNFDCDDRGNASVTLTATDDAGNSDQCTTDIEVKGTTVSINDLSQNEGTGIGFTFFFFQIERAESGCTLQIDYETADGTATLSDNDYVYGSGTAYYPPGGSNIRYFICRGKKDSNYESDENFWVEMSNPTVGVTFTKDKGEAMLKNDDAAPLIGNPNENPNFIFSDNQTLEGKASLYPKPVSQDLNISIPAIWLEGENLQVALYDIFGKRLIAFEISENHTVVDISVLKAGNYYIVFTNLEGKSKAEKFIKVD